jgi:hypothetical protein
LKFSKYTDRRQVFGENPTQQHYIEVYRKFKRDNFDTTDVPMKQSFRTESFYNAGQLLLDEDILNDDIDEESNETYNPVPTMDNLNFEVDKLMEFDLIDDTKDPTLDQVISTLQKTTDSFTN